MSDQRQGIFLENSWRWWQSFDNFIGEPWTFDYSKDIDIFNTLKGITLWPKEEVNISPSAAIRCYCTYSEDILYKVWYTSWSDIFMYTSDWTDFATFWTLEHTIDQWTLWIWSWNYGKPYNAVIFLWDIFILCDKQVIQYNPATTTATIVTPTGRYDSACDVIPSFNYHETLLIVAKNDKLYTYDPILWSPLWRSTVRDFSQGIIVSLLQYDEMVWVCMNHNWIDSTIYLLWGNFDVDDIWVLDVIPLEGISLLNTVQKGSKVFLMSNKWDGSGTWQFYELYGKTPVLIKEWRKGTKVSSNDNPWWVSDSWIDFIVKANSFVTWYFSQWYPKNWNTIYIPNDDWIFLYWSSNQKLPEVISYFRSYEEPSNPPLATVIFKDYIYVYSAWDEVRYYLWKMSSKRYAPYWYIKWRSYWWDMMLLEKETLWIAVAYDLTDEDCSIEVWIRRNGWGNGYDDFKVVHTITDHTKNFVVIDPTWEVWVSDIRGDRNYIDYALKLITTRDQKSPIVYEHAILFDYVRNKI